ncbi:MAG: polysaccharide biosynthesis protein [Burkholderiales bacterium]
MILQKFVFPVLSLPRWAKRFVVLIVDTALCILTVWLAFYLRLGELVMLSGNALTAAFMAVGIGLPIFITSGLYRAIFRYSGWPALTTVARAIVIYGILYASLFTAIGIQNVPRTVGIIQPILLLLFIGASRAVARIWLGDHYQTILKQAGRAKVLIYGAGTSGRQLVGAIANSPEMQVVGFLDDDDRLSGHVLNGQPIYSPKDLDSLVATLNVSIVLLAMPNLPRKRRNAILAIIRPRRIAVRTLPSMADMVHGKVSYSDLRDLDIDDLLGRETVMPNHILLAKSTRNKVVIVTGAGGSIGSELCRQILILDPSKLLMVDQSEFALYAIHQELLSNFPNKELTLIPLLGSVKDYDRMQEIMTTWRPDTLYHAAAYKHVPMVEHNVSEGIKNNVFGTLCAAKAAVQHGISDFVLVSTDKAVRPTNIMGASKRLSEIVLQALADTDTKTNFSIVRFGNVLDSSGSVVPKFRQQIRGGGPITLTHPDITRYFMTIAEASQLVIQAGAMARGGEVFVLDMGRPVKIYDLAQKMIELSGLTLRNEQNPDGDIEVEVVGLRPGEKLYEELLIGENPKLTIHPRVMKAQEDFLPWTQLEDNLKTLEMLLNVNDVGAIRTMMKTLVSGYTPSANIVDWIYTGERT